MAVRAPRRPCPHRRLQQLHRYQGVVLSNVQLVGIIYGQFSKLGQCCTWMLVQQEGQNEAFASEMLLEDCIERDSADSRDLANAGENTWASDVAGQASMITTFCYLSVHSNYWSICFLFVTGFWLAGTWSYNPLIFALYWWKARKQVNPLKHFNMINILFLFKRRNAIRWGTI